MSAPKPCEPECPICGGRCPPATGRCSDSLFSDEPPASIPATGTPLTVEMMLEGFSRILLRDGSHMEALSEFNDRGQLRGYNWSWYIRDLASDVKRQRTGRQRTRALWRKRGRR